MNLLFQDKKILNNSINTLIVDDSNRAIENIKNLLVNNEDINIIATANNVKEAIRIILKYKPSLVFLDVEMPIQNGFDLISELLKLNIELPKFIFTTGYDHYAIEALRNNAVDFLLKPIDPLELSLAIQRYKKTMNKTSEDLNLKTLVQTKRILLPTITGLKQIPLNNVLYFQKENNSTENVCVCYSSSNKETIPGHLSIKHIKELLPEDDFFQIDRCTIINLDYLTDIETKTRTCLLCKCDETIKLSISRARLKVFKEMHNTI